MILQKWHCFLAARSLYVFDSRHVPGDHSSVSLHKHSIDVYSRMLFVTTINIKTALY